MRQPRSRSRRSTTASHATSDTAKSAMKPRARLRRAVTCEPASVCGHFDITTVDWSQLEHIEGTATDVPEAHTPERRRRIRDRKFFCHQGTVSSATRALTPFIVALAKARHPFRLYALQWLGAIIRTSGGPSANAVRNASALTGRLFRNPATGESLRPDDALYAIRAPLKPSAFGLNRSSL